MIRALLYLQLVSAWNQFRLRLRRLRQPKYLAAFLVGCLYFFFYFYRPVLLSPPSPSGHPFAGGLRTELDLLATLLLAGIVASAWVFPRSRAALAFSEAEAAFLFPAPITRATLIHYKLLRSQAGILFSTLIMALLSRRFADPGGADPGSAVRPALVLAGWWIIFSTLSLHFIAASFTRTRLLECGVSHWTRRAVVLGLLLFAGLGAWWWARTQLPPPAPNPAPIAAWKSLLGQVRQVAEAQPFATLLWPFRSVIQPVLAPTPAAFVRAVLPALFLLGLHYAWVIRSAVAFEEASLEQARRRAERLASLQRTSGHSFSGQAVPAPFALAPVGPAAVAFLWKNLIYARSLCNRRLGILLAISFGIPALVIGLNARRGEFFDVVPILLVMGLVWSVLLGPQLLRHDLRQDLHSAELLKLYPLPGWKIILGELLAPVLMLSVIQWILLALLAALFTGIPGGAPIEPGTRLSLAATAGLVCPTLNLLSFLVPNAATLLFPAWLQTGPGGPQGIEATGQRLIFLLGQLVVFAFALAPGIAAALAAHLLIQIAVPTLLAIPLAGVAAAVFLLAEAALGIGLLGKMLERLDVASELRS